MLNYLSFSGNEIKFEIRVYPVQSIGIIETMSEQINVKTIPNIHSALVAGSITSILETGAGPPGSPSS